MKRTLALAMTTALFGALGGAPAAAAPACVEPTPVLTYEADRIDVSLEVDYTGCKWWRKSMIELSASVTQGPVFGVGMDVWSACVVVTTSGRKAIARTCDISVGFEHLPAEAATYSGYFEYPWNKGTERIEFEYVCVSAAVAARCEEN
jgi:hypothetical protein